MEDVKVRELKTKDLLKITSILGKSAGETRKELANVGAMSGMELGLLIFQVILSKADDDEMKEWLASLIDMEVEEFEETDFDTTLDIVEELQQRDDVDSFFKRAARLFSNQITTKEK